MSNTMKIIADYLRSEGFDAELFENHPSYIKFKFEGRSYFIDERNDVEKNYLRIRLHLRPPAETLEGKIAVYEAINIVNGLHKIAKFYNTYYGKHTWATAEVFMNDIEKNLPELFPRCLRALRNARYEFEDLTRDVVFSDEED